MGREKLRTVHVNLGSKICSLTHLKQMAHKREARHIRYGMNIKVHHNVAGIPVERHHGALGGISLFCGCHIGFYCRGNHAYAKCLGKDEHVARMCP